MDKRRQELEELSDDIHLALLMDDYAERLGKQTQAEVEDAINAGELVVPKALDDACLKIIRNTDNKNIKNTMKKGFRYALTAAATVVFIIGTMMIAQAAGINVFGTLASWTDSVFHYKTEDKPTQTETPPFAEVEAVLVNLGIPVEFSPYQLPEGYSIKSIRQSETGEIKLVSIVAGNETQECHILIEEYLETDLIENALWEKSDPSATVFSSNGRDFYLIENEQGWSGVWSDGRYVISLLGYNSCEQLKYTIQSIGVH